MNANERSARGWRAGRALGERLGGARLLQYILMIAACVVISVISRLPSLLPLGVPRLLGVSAALIVGFSALFVLSCVVLQRLLPRRTASEMDANVVRLKSYYHQLLDDSALNPLRRSS